MSTIPSREEALFTDALAQPPAERNAFLAKVCGTDYALLSRLIALIAAHEGLESLMASSAASPLLRASAGNLTRYEREVLLAGIEKQLAALREAATP